jgi:cell division protein FtsL
MKWIHILLLIIWMTALLIAGIGIVWQGAEENALRRQRGAFMKERRDLLTEQGRLHATLTMEGNLARVQAAIERQRLPLRPQPMQSGAPVPVLAAELPGASAGISATERQSSEARVAGVAP